MPACSKSLWLRCPLVLILLATSSHSHANKHGHKHHQPHGGHQRNRETNWNDSRDHQREDIAEHYFTNNHRYLIRDYYDQQYRSGQCPPGLSKKHNSCQPPGRAKRWHIGRPLPRDVVYFDLPPIVHQQLGYPPAGHRFVRVAGDILLIAIGSGLVIDAITDLSRR